MTGKDISRETLAALLDGTLSSDERARVLATLARSDDAYDDFIEAIAITREIDAAGLSVVRPAPRRLRWRRALIVAVPALIAASVLVIVRDRQATVAVANADGITTVVRSPLAAAGASVAGTTPLSDIRGAASDLRPSSRLFRMGVRYAELEAAYSSGDTAAVAAAFGALRDAASGTTDGRLEVLALQTRASTVPPADRDALATRLRGAEGDTWPGWFDLGAWTASARLAAAARQVGFFAPTGDAIVALSHLLDAEQRLTPAQRQQAPEALTIALRALAARPIDSEAQLADATALLQQALLAGSR